MSDAINFKSEAGSIKIKDIFVSQVGESDELRRETARAADGWYAVFTHDVFG